MNRAFALACLSAFGAVASGCGSQNEQRSVPPPTKVFELADYALNRRGYTGTGSSLRRIDPSTLRPLTRRGLRLGGWSYFRTLSPDRRAAAFGLEFGEVVFVDLATERITGRVWMGDPDLSVHPIGWPRPDLLVAHTCEVGGKSCRDNRLVLVDPQRLRRRAEVAIPGFAEVAYARENRRSVLLVTEPYGPLRPARLLVVDPTGLVRDVDLARIRVGYELRALGPHHKSAAFAIDGDRAIVFGADSLVAEVALRTLRVRYRRIRELDVDARSLRASPTRRWYGTSNPYGEERRLVERLAAEAVVVSGRETMLVRGGFRESSLRPHVVSTRTWTARPARPFETSDRAGPFRLASTGRLERTGPRGPFTLAAYDARGHVRWRLRFRRYFTWSSFDRFVYVGPGNGRTTRIYDLRTGRLLRRIRPTDVEPAFRWKPPR